jgi:Xaa-Pro aminopeptidase
MNVFNEDISIIYNDDNIPNPNFIYFTKTNVFGLLVFSRKHRPFILTASRDYEKAKKSRLKVYRMNKKKRLFGTLKLILKRKKIHVKTIGIDKEHISLLIFEKLKKETKGRNIDISEKCRIIRSMKNGAEIENLRKACRITDKVFSKLITNFNFKTEPEISKFIEREIMNLGGELSFPSIVASGKNGSIPHHDSQSRLGKGFLILDFGAKYKGYHADMTRTIYLGRPSEKEIEEYDNLLNIQKELIASVHESMTGDMLYKKAKKLLGKKSKYFIHALGHGVGLEIHESPSLSPDSEQMIQNKTVFTIEPGVYYKNKFGIRIEDTILYDRKPILLTKSSKELIRV